MLVWIHPQASPFLMPSPSSLCKVNIIKQKSQCRSDFISEISKDDFIQSVQKALCYFKHLVNDWNGDRIEAATFQPLYTVRESRERSFAHLCDMLCGLGRISDGLNRF